MWCLFRGAIGSKLESYLQLQTENVSLCEFLIYIKTISDIKY